MTIILASDHAGFALKEAVKSLLESKKYQILDVGAHELVPEDDYPPYMIAAAMKVAADLKGETRAILFGKSGQGEAMVAIVSLVFARQFGTEEMKRSSNYRENITAPTYFL